MVFQAIESARLPESKTNHHSKTGICQKRVPQTEETPKGGGKEGSPLLDREQKLGVGDEESMDIQFEELDVQFCVEWLKDIQF